MKLFGKAALRKKLDRALAASERGDAAEAARLYEEAASDAAALSGPYDPVALTAVEDAAAHYAQLGEVERAREMLVELIPKMERSPELGPDSRYTINARAGLAATYGMTGDHQKALELLLPELARATRALGADDETTFGLRENMSNAQRSLAEPELDRLLELSPGTDGGKIDPSAADSDRALALDAISKCGSYRSKRIMRMTAREKQEDEEQGMTEHVVEANGVDRLRVLQTIHDPDEGDLYDLWVVAGDRRYRYAGVWIDESDWPREQRAEGENLDRTLKLDAYRSLLNDGAVGEIRVVDADGERYLVFEYGSVPSALLMPEVRFEREQTVLWIRQHDHLLARADANASGVTDEGSIALEIHQAFTSYGAEIAVNLRPARMIVRATPPM